MLLDPKRNDTEVDIKTYCDAMYHWIEDIRCRKYVWLKVRCTSLTAHISIFNLSNNDVKCECEMLYEV